MESMSRCSGGFTWYGMEDGAMTRAEWGKRDASEPYGGDFRNIAQVYRSAFRDPLVAVCSLGAASGTGCWQTVYVRLSDGRAFSRKLVA